MLRSSAVIGLVSILVAPAAATEMHSFTIDPAKSTFTASVVVFGITFSGGGPVAGTYSMMLEPPSGIYPTRNWNVTASLDTISATNTTQIHFVVPTFADVLLNPGDFNAMDFNMTKGAIPSTVLSGGPNISSGTLSTEILVSVYDQNMPGYVTDNGAAGEWDPMNWNIQVSDADYLGVAGVGDVESHLSAVYTAPNGITYTTELYGRLVPEPATMGLLALGGLALLRRRPV